MIEKFLIEAKKQTYANEEKSFSKTSINWARRI